MKFLYLAVCLAVGILVVSAQNEADLQPFRCEEIGGIIVTASGPGVPSRMRRVKSDASLVDVDSAVTDMNGNPLQINSMGFAAVDNTIAFLYAFNPDTRTFWKLGQNQGQVQGFQYQYSGPTLTGFLHAGDVVVENGRTYMYLAKTQSSAMVLYKLLIDATTTSVSVVPGWPKTYSNINAWDLAFKDSLLYGWNNDNSKAFSLDPNAPPASAITEFSSGDVRVTDVGTFFLGDDAGTAWLFCNEGDVLLIDYQTGNKISSSNVGGAIRRSDGAACGEAGFVDCAECGEECNIRLGPVTLTGTCNAALECVTDSTIPVECPGCTGAYEFVLCEDVAYKCFKTQCFSLPLGSDGPGASWSIVPGMSSLAGLNCGDSLTTPNSIPDPNNGLWKVCTEGVSWELGGSAKFFPWCCDCESPPLDVCPGL